MTNARMINISGTFTDPVTDQPPDEETARRTLVTAGLVVVEPSEAAWPTSSDTPDLVEQL